MNVLLTLLLLAVLALPVAVFIKSSIPPTATNLFFALGDAITVESLQNKLLSLNESIKSLQAKADAENRELTDDEQKEMSNMFDAFDLTKAEIARRERIAANDAEMAGTAANLAQARLTQGVDTRAAEASAAANAARQANPSNGTPTARIEGSRENRGSWGWRSYGEFMAQVRRASLPGGMQNMDPRLVVNAATTYSSEGIGADGGFAVPPDFRSTIMQKVMGEESILARTDQQTSSSNSFTVPKDETTPWQNTGGVQAYWTGEGDTKQQSKLALESSTVKLEKLTALVPVTDELLQDAASLSNYLNSKAPVKMDFKVTDALINGTGAGQPLGMLNSASLVTVTPESGQAADTIRFDNITKMWARLYSGCMRNAVWMINQDIIPQLLGMQFPGTGTAVPAYLPPGGLASAPYGTLMGRPVVVSEAMKTIGDVGDIVLVDWSKYLSIVKAGGIRQDVSIHVWFDQDITAFRFVLRVGGQPWWSAPITRANGNNTLGWAVALGAR